MKKKKPMVDAQDVKAALLKSAAAIGKRKRIRVGEFFELMFGAMAK